MHRVAAKRILIVDASLLAKNMYRLLFMNLPGYEVDYWEKLAPFSGKKGPHLIILNSNALSVGQSVDLPTTTPVILLASKGRTDLHESFQSKKEVTFIEKPFYPYDLLSEINRILVKQPKVKKRGRPLKR